MGLTPLESNLCRRREGTKGPLKDRLSDPWILACLDYGAPRALYYGVISTIEAAEQSAGSLFSFKRAVDHFRVEAVRRGPKWFGISAVMSCCISLDQEPAFCTR